MRLTSHKQSIVLLALTLASGCTPKGDGSSSASGGGDAPIDSPPAGTIAIEPTTQEETEVPGPGGDNSTDAA